MFGSPLVLINQTVGSTMGFRDRLRSIKNKAKVCALVVVSAGATVNLGGIVGIMTMMFNASLPLGVILFVMEMVAQALGFSLLRWVTSMI